MIRSPRAQNLTHATTITVRRVQQTHGFGEGHFVTGKAIIHQLCGTRDIQIFQSESGLQAGCLMAEGDAAHIDEVAKGSFYFHREYA
jgi:hypothetical protein